MQGDRAGTRRARRRHRPGRVREAGHRRESRDREPVRRALAAHGDPLRGRRAAREHLWRAAEEALREVVLAVLVNHQNGGRRARRAGSRFEGQLTGGGRLISPGGSRAASRQHFRSDRPRSCRRRLHGRRRPAAPPGARARPSGRQSDVQGSRHGRQLVLARDSVRERCDAAGRHPSGREPHRHLDGLRAAGRCDRRRALDRVVRQARQAPRDLRRRARPARRPPAARPRLRRSCSTSRATASGRTRPVQGAS